MEISRTLFPILQSDVLHIPLADDVVQCIMTSPPYWGLRDYEAAGQLGKEKTPEEYVERMVYGAFREIKRVLRPDGTLWLNMGDCFATSVNGRKAADIVGDDRCFRDKPYSTIVPGLKAKDLVGMPWRIARELQADGWWLRSDIIWAKTNPMPESQKGWRWERHRIKVGDTGKPLKQVTNKGSYDVISGGSGNVAIWEDCPGCKKCLPNDGLVLRRGSWRPTKSHEYIFLLTKGEQYYCDGEAVKELYTRALNRWGGPSLKSDTSKTAAYKEMQHIGNSSSMRVGRAIRPDSEGKNMRDVWKIPTKSYSGAHFATFPEKLPELCIKAGTSERGCCPECGAAWARVLKKDQDTGSVTTLGWRPTCKHNAGEPIPCLVCDPFAGSGTTGLVALQLGRRFIGGELKREYLELAKKRLHGVQVALMT